MYSGNMLRLPALLALLLVTVTVGCSRDDSEAVRPSTPAASTSESAVLDTPVSFLDAQVPEAEPKALTYTVEPGDSLYEIALRHETTVRVLAESNGIADPSLIFPGQVIAIPTKP